MISTTDTPSKYSAYNKQWRANNRSRHNAVHREYMKIYHARCKKAVYDFYGNKCNCCGETELKFLTIDHVNNDGYKERRLIGHGIRRPLGLKLYRQVINQGFPPKYQILCYNCNCGKQRNDGVCPHIITN